MAKQEKQWRLCRFTCTTPQAYAHIPIYKDLHNSRAEKKKCGIVFLLTVHRSWWSSDSTVNSLQPLQTQLQPLSHRQYTHGNAHTRIRLSHWEELPARAPRNLARMPPWSAIGAEPSLKQWAIHANPPPPPDAFTCAHTHTHSLTHSHTHKKRHSAVGCDGDLGFSYLPSTTALLKKVLQITHRLMEGDREKKGEEESRISSLSLSTSWNEWDFVFVKSYK